MLWLAIGAPAWLTLLAYIVGLAAGAVMLYDISATDHDSFRGGREAKLVWIVVFVFSIGLGLQPFVPIAYYFAVYVRKGVPEAE